MPIESATYISQLNTANPTAADPKSEGDDQIRLVKTVLKAQFPNFTAAAVTPTVAEVNYLAGVTSGIQTQLNTLTGTFASYALKAGETYSGAHNFTGATLTVAAPSATNSPVTKAYADALAFASALPSQSAAVAGLSVTTDGATATWSLSSADQIALIGAGVY